MLSQKKQYWFCWRGHGFRPHWGLSLAAAVLVVVTLRLSIWQFDRAEQKQALEHAAAAAMTAEPMPVLPLVAAESLAPYQRVVLHGWFDAEHEILLDNRIHAGRAGYHVLTPFLLSDAAGALASGEKMVMVNRGWLDGGARRYPPPTIPPPPSGWLRVVGISAADSSDAFLLSPDTVAGLVHQHIDLADFAARRGLNLLPVIVIADGENAQAASAAGLVPVAVRRDYKSGRSIVYAWQWLTFAALTIVFYFILGMKKLPPQKPR